MAQASEFVSILVKCEIDRIVAEAAMERRTLSAPHAAADILKTYPKCGLPAERVADAVMMAAAKAAIAVELGRPDKEADGRAMLAAL
jgi:hypothetical protein